jgi:hypothetical protein
MHVTLLCTGTWQSERYLDDFGQQTLYIIKTVGQDSEKCVVGLIFCLVNVKPIKIVEVKSLH